MNRNQKIALGCGGAGCLGLIVLAVVGVIGYVTYTNTGSSPFANNNGNDNTNSEANVNENSNISVDQYDSSMSDDDKHKLFQAAGVAGDSTLHMKVLEKIGFPSGTGPGYEKFIGEHFNWAIKNLEFMQSVNTPEKGRAYVEAHLDD